MVTISDSAATFIQRSLQEHGNSKLGLRIAVYPDKEHACFNYGFGFDFQSEGDKVFSDNGVFVIISASQLEYIDGAELDYVALEEGEEPNLIVMNPNDPSYVPPKKS
jgi:Fe-S cluster assembly iron-binding protein IscA